MTQRHVQKWSQEVKAVSKYTTGELAKLCGVTVRTVQYYDARGILVPTQLSEGGRRLYSQEDVKKLKIICFLRELDIPIQTIGRLFAEEHPEDLIGLLLQQQEQELRGEIADRQEKLGKVAALQRELKSIEHFTVDSIGDIAYLMANRKKLKRIRVTVLAVGIPLEIAEIATLILGFCTGIWWPYLLGLAATVAGGIWITLYYYKNVVYICPKCHSIFRPRFWECFWANHTPNTRRLTCPHCGHKGFCIETCAEE